MGLGMRVVEWLQSQRHDVTHLRVEGLQRLSDVEIFNKAISENRVILTFDLDFGEIVALSKGQKISVVIFRLHNTRTIHIIDRLSAILPALTEALEKGAVVVVEESRHRVRYLPIGSE